MSIAYLNPSPAGPTVADALLEAGRMMNYSHHRVVVLSAQLEESSEWWLSFAGTAAHWIAAQLDVSVSTAREWIRIGKALRALPAVDAAFAAHELSYAKVRALTRVAEPATEIELVDLARSVPAGRLGHAFAAWTQRHEDHEERTARHDQDQSFRHRVEPDGMVAFTIRLAPEDAAETLAAVEATMMRRSLGSKSPSVAEAVAEGGEDASAGAWDSSGSLAQQRADAFVELVTDGGATIEAEVVLHVRGDGCAYDDGTPVTDTVVERVAPEAFLRALIHDAEGRPINCHRRRHERERRGQAPPAA